MKKIITYLAILLFIITSLNLGRVQADDTLLFGACKGNASASTVCASKGTNTNPANHLIKVAADIIAVATGVAAVIVIIVGGITMITSAGNTEAVANSRKRIVAALIGLVIVALSWTIISFVTDRLIK